LSVRTTVITGATRGIGLAIAERLGAAGQVVVGIARNKPDLDFPGVLFLGDMSCGSEVERVLAEIRAEHAVDNVVNNLGIANPQPLAEVDSTTFLSTIDINLGLAIKVTQAFLPAMKAKQRGRVLNISSRAALGRELRTSYSAAKAGMIGMTRSWALELARDGITANVLAPGLTDTGMLRLNNPDIEKRAAAIPMGRLGRPADVAAAAEFLVSDDAAYITGQVLYVCGGLSIGLTHV
jgi:NAD(P)-dependent dehydrogenase (short-subunit alcohol dehydrogenase family)